MHAQFTITGNVSLEELNRIKKAYCKSNYSNVEYHILEFNGRYGIVGFMRNYEQYCAIDLYNDGVNSTIFLKWLHATCCLYENIYCVPNSQGAIIWQAFGYKSADLYIRPSLLKLLAKWRIRFIKFCFINMLFRLSSDSGIKINKKIYYSNVLPKRIEIDTF